MRSVILVSMLVCCVGAVESAAGVTYNFGGEWDIDFYVSNSLDIMDSSTGVPTTVNFLDGAYTPMVNVYDNSVFNMFGGKLCMVLLDTLDNSTAYICGGVISGTIALTEHSQVTIAGTGFNYPDGTYSNTVGQLTGTLLNGGEISVDFLVGEHTTMTLVPEPATVLLLGLGAVLLRRKVFK